MNTCMICLEYRGILINIGNVSSGELRLKLKLEKIIPEVEWKNDYRVCASCSEQVENSYNFRELCINSEDSRRKLWNEVNWKSVAIKSENEDFDGEAVEDLVINFEETFQFESSKCHKEDHNQISKEFFCKHCNKQYPNKDLCDEHEKSCFLIANKNELKKEIDIEIEYKPEENREKPDEESKCVEDHIQFQDPGEFCCKHCSKQYSNENLCNEHENSCFVVANKNELKKETEHKLGGNREKIYEESKCDICETSFNNKYLLKRHKNNVHATEKKFKCDQCSSTFVSSVYLNAHKKYHSGDRKHICLFCGKGFITASDLYHHEKIHENKREYKCTECNKAFNTSSDLHKHNLCVHLDKSLWKYSCGYCKRKFPLKTNLDTHLKTHTGEKNFACHLCNKKLISRSALNRHLGSHTNVKSYKCKFCNLGYKHTKSLDIHMSKSHDIGNVKTSEKAKKFVCHLCPKSYHAKSKLDKHIRTHTGEKPFKCPTCDKCFIDKSYVKQHLKSSHDINT